MTRLKFPEPAADLLQKGHKILNRHVTPHTPGKSGWAIGGGSALAARWQHRWSKDLDVFVRTDTEFARLTESQNPELWREMRAAGAHAIKNEGTLRFKFGDAQIEILGDEPVPRTGHKRTELECGNTIVRATVLSTEQILYSKLLHRGMGAPVRDLYDIAVASIRAPSELAIAVNGRPERLIKTATWTWDAQNKAYGKKAERELKNVPSEYKHIQENPGTQAARAATDHLYQFMQIKVTGKAITTTCRSKQFEQTGRYTTPTEARNGFEASGLNAALKARGWNPRRILGEAVAALKNAQTLTITPIEGREDGDRAQQVNIVRRRDAPIGGRTQSTATRSTPKRGDTDINHESGNGRNNR